MSLVGGVEPGSPIGLLRAAWRVPTLGEAQACAAAEGTVSLRA